MYALLTIDFLQTWYSIMFFVHLWCHLSSFRLLWGLWNGILILFIHDFSRCWTVLPASVVVAIVARFTQSVPTLGNNIWANVKFFWSALTCFWWKYTSENLFCLLILIQWTRHFELRRTKNSFYWNLFRYFLLCVYIGPISSKCEKLKKIIFGCMLSVSKYFIGFG